MVGQITENGNAGTATAVLGSIPNRSFDFGRWLNGLSDCLLSSGGNPDAGSNPVLPVLVRCPNG